MKHVRLIPVLAGMFFAVVCGAFVAYALETEDDPTLTSDAAPGNVPTKYPDNAGDHFPSTPPPESEMVKPYTLSEHRFLAGSMHHPNPPVTDHSFDVDLENKTVKVGAAQQLNAFRDWAQERYFDAKFEALEKRFKAIETAQADLAKRLGELEKNTGSK